MEETIEFAVKEVPDMNKRRAREIVREYYRSAKPVNSAFRKLEEWSPSDYDGYNNKAE